MSKIRLAIQHCIMLHSMDTGIILSFMNSVLLFTKYCCLPNREIVVLLLEHEASPNIVDSKGSSPLHLAAWAGHSDIVRLLLTSGVRVTQIDLRVSPTLTIFHFLIILCFLIPK